LTEARDRGPLSSRSTFGGALVKEIHTMFKAVREGLAVSGRSKCTTPGRNERLQSVPPGGRPKGCTVTGKNRSMCGNYGQHTLGARTTSNLNVSRAGLVDSTHCPRAENPSQDHPAVSS